MHLKFCSKCVCMLAACLLCLQFTCFMVLASPQEEVIEKAKALQRQAIEQHEQGHHGEAIQLAKQALETFKAAFKNEKIRTGISEASNQLEMVQGKFDIASTASIFLKNLESYLSDENIKNLEKADKILTAQNRYSVLSKENEAKLKSADKQQSKLVKEDQKQQINKIAEAAAKKMLQGKLDKEDLKKQAMALFNEELPRQKAMAVQAASHGTDYFHELVGLNGNYQDAFDQFIRILSADKEFIDQVLPFIPEKQKLDYLITKQKNLHAFLSLVIEHLPHDPKARKKAFDTWIGRKGLALESQREFQESLVETNDPNVSAASQQLTQVRAKLSKLTVTDLDASGNEAVQRQVAELEKEKQLLEIKLIRLSQTYALKKKIDTADAMQIAAKLPENSVLLDFARIAIFNFQPDDAEDRWLPPHYIVFVLHAGNGEILDMIDLGEAERIDSIINRFKDELKNENDFLREGRKIKKRAQKLYSLVFAPIVESICNVSDILISPDGNLNLIPFEVLQNSDGKYLIENYTFNYLPASRDVLRFGEIREKAGKSVAMGNPDFDSDGKMPAEKAPARLSAQPGTIPRRSSNMHGLFPPLPHTAEEVKSLASLLGKKNVTIYLGEDASEASLFSHTAPKMLHLATHGFFLGDQALDSLFENPLLRSGIVLAGANRTLSSQTPKNSNGIVTAEKILGLKLRGTELVVLSACQTGEGEVQAGEGVFGLRRAFVQAGTQSLVMSMWSVPDRETQELMVQFYQNISAGMNRNHALRQAALKEMQIAKERYGHAHPLFWGAFVFLGES